MMRISNNKEIMGRYKNSMKINVIGYTLFGFMSLGSLLLIGSLFI